MQKRSSRPSKRVDVKPSSIIVTPAGFAYLVNFTIAVTKGETPLEAEGEIIGTSNYMAPERVTGNSATPAVDVYGLACALHQSLTGALPYPGDDFGEQAMAHLTQDPPRPSELRPDLPPGFDEVVARGMAKRPEDRYPTASEFAAAASRAVASTTG